MSQIKLSENFIKSTVKLALNEDLYPLGDLTTNLVKNKKLKTNGTIDFINGQKAFLSNSIYNLIPKIGDKKTSLHLCFCFIIISLKL